MPKENHYCATCGNKMVYDKVMSKSKHHSTWWCLNCGLIEYYQTFKVHDAVRSVRRYIFHGKLG